METTSTIQFNALPKTESHESSIGFWASYWGITPDELQEIITEIGSSSFMKIDGYLKMRRASA